MEVKIVKEATGSYLAIPKVCSTENYKEKMIKSCEIKGLLPVSIRNMNGESFYYYNTKGVVRIEDYLKNHKLKEMDFKNIFESLAELQERMINYLLDRDNLVTMEDCIYIDEKTSCLWFAYYPQTYEETINFTYLAEQMMDAVASDDEIAMRLACSFYDSASQGNTDIVRLLDDIYCDMSLNSELCEEKDNTFSQNVEVQDSYYYAEEKEDTETTDKTIIKAVVFCASLIFISVGGYAIIYMNASLMNILRIKPESYAIVGGIMAAILTITIIIIIQLSYSKIRKADEEKSNKAIVDGLNPIIPGSMEYEEFMASVDTNVDKVLKSE